MQNRSPALARIAFVLIGIAVMLGSQLDFTAARRQLDGYSLHGEARRYTPQLHSRICFAMQATACAFFSAAALATLLAKQLSLASRSLQADASTLVRDARGALPTLPQGAVLLGIMLAGLVLRLKYMNYPMRYDESETYLSAVLPPWFVTISSYYAPNNHILHSLLAKVSCALFGGAPWALRLPALCAGTALIPATYLTTRGLAGANLSPRMQHSAGLLAALFVAGSAPLTEHAVNARGYSLVGLFWMISILLATYCRRTNNSAAWIGLSVTFACGLWTIPTMLFPIVGINIWMILTSMIPGACENRMKIWRWLIACNVLAVFVTIALYLPVLVVDGPAALFGNPWVTPQSLSAIADRQPALIAAVWKVSQTGVSRELKWLMAGAAVISLLSFGRCGTSQFPIFIIGTLVVFGLALAMRVLPLGRVFMFLLPTYFAEVSLVLVFLGSRMFTICERSIFEGTSHFGIRRNSILTALGAVVISTTVIWIAGFAGRDDFVEDSDQTGDADKVAAFLQPRIQEGDVVVSSVPTNGPLEYYFLRMGLPRSILVRHHSSSEGYQRVFVVIHSGRGQSLRSVLEGEMSANAPPPADFAEIAQFPKARIYVGLRNLP